MFLLMQLLGGTLGLAAVLGLYPHAAQLATDLTHPANPPAGARP